MTPVWLGILGSWILSDAVYSLMLYWTAPGCEGVKRQTFKRDHWIRFLRAGIGLAMIGGALWA